MQKYTFALNRFIWAFFAAGAVLIDFISKRLVLSRLSPDGDAVIIPGILKFTYVENRGAVFGILSDNRWIFLTFSLIAIAALCIFCARAKKLVLFEQICVGMILGGGVGNMIDRVFYGYVVDFINVICFDFWHWVFNLADAFIDVGAVLLLVYILFFMKNRDKANGKKNDGTV